MKLLVVCALVAVASCDFMEFLTNIQNHHSFQRLPSSEKLLFGELVVAAEEGPQELKEFIDRVGFLKVVALMDHMSQYDAQKFEAYLAEASNYTHHAPENQDVVTGKRAVLERRDGDEHEHSHSHSESHSHVQAQQIANATDAPARTEGPDPNWVAFSAYLQSLEGEYYGSLPAKERETYFALTKAAESGNLQAYIDQVGYGPIFGLMEFLDYRHANQLYDLLQAALAGTGTQKRQLLGDEREEHHHSEFHSYLSGLSSSYYQHLPQQEKNTFNQLMLASQHQNVTCYIDQVGYGPVFGLMEQLDYTHANRVYDFITSHLSTETATVC